MKAWRIARLGMTRTFQNIRLFKRLSVINNVRVSFHASVKYRSLAAMLRLPSYWKEEARIENEAMELLKIFNLDGKRDELASSLSYGEQRKLEIARAMAAKPQVLLLDEPAAGMNPQETQDLCRLITFIRDHFGLTILLIEHDMSLVMKICERILVLDYGELIAQGLPDEIRNNPQVIKAYLGEEVKI
jgi:branched-chain amino acid transport system ATP-binding protein